DEFRKLLYVVFEAIIGFVEAAADTEGMRGQTRAAVLLKNFEDLFPVAEQIEQRCDGADVQCMCAKPKHVAGHAVQLGENDAYVIRSRWGLDVQELLYCFAISQTVRDRSNVIHAVHVGIEHRVGTMLGDLLHSTMEIPDDAFRP